jgi:hypothetical protein
LVLLPDPVPGRPQAASVRATTAKTIRFEGRTPVRDLLGLPDELASRPSIIAGANVAVALRWLRTRHGVVSS